jgi:ribosomal protein S4E
MSTKSEGFKVGDKIKWKESQFFSQDQDKHSPHSNLAGVTHETTLTITKIIPGIYGGDEMIYTCPHIGGWYASRFEKVQETPKPSKPVFKIGDIVRMKADKPVFGRGGVSKGDIGKVVAIGDKSREALIALNRRDEGLTPYVDFYVTFPGQEDWCAKAEDLELVQNTRQKVQTVKTKSPEVKPDWDIPVNKASRQMAKILEESKGSFVSVTFIKKNGTERVLAGRYKSSWENTLTMYDNQKQGYRTLHIDKILSVRANGLKISLA